MFAFNLAGLMTLLGYYLKRRVSLVPQGRNCVVLIHIADFYRSNLQGVVWKLVEDWSLRNRETLSKGISKSVIKIEAIWQPLLSSERA